MSGPPYFEVFKTAVEALFNNWTALQLAVDQGMGGQNGRNTAFQMIEFIAQYCCTNEKTDAMDLANLLEDIMDEDFDTVCEDNSPQELGLILYRFLQLCRTNNQEQMMLEVSRLPACKLWLCQPQIQHSMPIQPHEIIEEDEDDNENGLDADEPMEEDPDPGWTVVKTKKKH